MNNTHDLASLLEKEERGSRLPLPLVKFARAQDVSKPSAAMKKATSDLLSRIAAPEVKAGPVSVAALCRASSVSLRGIDRVVNRDSRRWTGDRRSVSHTGQIVFERDGATVTVPAGIEFSTARLSVAHELGHFLIHASGTERTIPRSPSTPEEEALAEYGGRLLLMPIKTIDLDTTNYAAFALRLAQTARTTLHSAVERLNDPDVAATGFRGAILWRMRQTLEQTHIADRLVPHWHLCSPAYVPIGRCKARRSSVVATAASGGTKAWASEIEDVRIGSFAGRFRVDVVSWGSVLRGTRLVLSAFSDVSGNSCGIRERELEKPLQGAFL